MSGDPYLPANAPGAGEIPPGAEDDLDARPGCPANAVTLIFLGLTALFAVYFVILLINPYVPINPFPPRTPLPVILVATPNPNAPLPTVTPTKLPETPRLSTSAPTASLTPTLLPPATETPVVVVPPTVPTNTPVPSPTMSGEIVVQGVFTPPPPGNPAEYTRSPFPFTIYGDSVSYIPNPNGQGCRWASIAGSVTNLQGEPLAGLAVQITGEGLDEIHFTGTALTYGPGGFEIFLNGAPLRGEYVLQLLSQTGAPISGEFPVTTSPLCEENVAIVNFVQNHPW